MSALPAQLSLMALEAVFAAVLLLALFRARRVWGLAPL